MVGNLAMFLEILDYGRPEAVVPEEDVAAAKNQDGFFQIWGEHGNIIAKKSLGGNLLKAGKKQDSQKFND
jgi:hypothetical protein